MTEEDCTVKVDYVVKLLERLGFLINIKKSSLKASQKVTYLGFCWDLAKWRISLKPQREKDIRQEAKKLRQANVVTCRQASRFLGRAISTVGAVPLARGRVRTLQWEFLASCRTPEQFDDKMMLSQESKEELVFWEGLPENIDSPLSVPWSGQTIDTDASPEGLGFYFQGRLFSEPAPTAHICTLELLALDRAIDHLRSELKPGLLTWRVDNQSALFAIKNEGSTRSWDLSWLAVSILKKSQELGVVINPIRVSSEENLLADSASRHKKVPDWSLNQATADKMFSLWGRPDVDLMASDISRKAPFFYSWSRNDKEALALDALAPDLDWTKWTRPYCFPPFPLIEAVLKKILTQRVKRVILVVPWWPSKPFFPLLKVKIKTLTPLYCMIAGDVGGGQTIEKDQEFDRQPGFRGGPTGAQQGHDGRLHSFWKAGRAGISWHN